MPESIGCWRDFLNIVASKLPEGLPVCCVGVKIVLVLATHKGEAYGQCLLFVCYKAEIIKHAFQLTLHFRKQVEWDLKRSSLSSFNMDKFQGPLAFFPSTVGPLCHVCVLISSISSK